MTPDEPQFRSLSRDERRERILQALRERGRVVASELSETLAVSPDTIRRDLEDLANAGQLRRVHGGALPHSPGVAGYAARLRQAPVAKTATIEYRLGKWLDDRHPQGRAFASAYTGRSPSMVTRCMTRRAPL